MTVILVLGFCIFFLTVDAFRSMETVPKGTSYTTPGFEALGCLSQDGGKKIEQDYEI
jgi:hypothetical protein